MIKTNTSNKLIEESIKKIIEIVGKENFFLEVQPQKPEDNPELFKINKKILQISDSLKIDLVVNNNFHYISKEDKKVL
jgi:DNA polymerase III alpha subunit